MEDINKIGEESLSFNDIISQNLSSEEKTEFLAIFELKNEDDEDSSSLAESLSLVESKNRHIAQAILMSILKLFKAKIINSENIFKLVRNIKLGQVPDQETAFDYQSNSGRKISGNILWKNFEIFIYDNIDRKNDNGEYVIDIEHCFLHEIGHSFSESEAIGIEEIMFLFQDINLDFESEYIKEISGQVDEDRFLKERFSETFSYFVQAMNSEDKANTFFKLRMKNSSLDSEHLPPDKLNDALKQSNDLFKKLNNIWPEIKDRLNQYEITNRAESNYADLRDYGDSGVKEDYRKKDTTESQDSAPLTPDFSSKSQKKPNVIQEGNSLGRNQNHSESFLQSCGKVLVEFSKEIDIFGGSNEV